MKKIILGLAILFSLSVQAQKDTYCNQVKTCVSGSTTDTVLWKVGGNSNIVTVGYLGTKNNAALGFKTRDTARMVINGTFGAHSPSNDDIRVIGNILQSGNFNNSGIMSVGSLRWYASPTLFHVQGTSSFADTATFTTLVGVGKIPSATLIGLENKGGLDVLGGFRQITHFSGAVQIHIGSNIAEGGVVMSVLDSVTGKGSSIASTGGNYLSSSINTSQQNLVQGTNQTYFTTACASGTATPLLIDSTGRIGISISAPTRKLDINGVTLARDTLLTRHIYPTDSIFHIGDTIGAATGARPQFFKYAAIKTINTAPFTPSGTTDAAGTVGDFAWDESYIYNKTVSGWRRIVWDAIW